MRTTILLRRAIFRRHWLSLLLAMTAILSAAPANLRGAEESPAEAATDNTFRTEYGWGAIICPRTCAPGEEFEIRIEFNNAQEATNNWSAEKLASHVFWSAEGKWGGYLTHFASSTVTKPGAIILKGKFSLTDAQKKEAKYIHVNLVLSSDWKATEENTALKEMGPRIPLRQ